METNKFVLPEKWCVRGCFKPHVNITYVPTDKEITDSINQR